MPRFQWFEPRSLDEALALLAHHGADAKVLAGGTDLVPRMERGVLQPKVVVGLGRIAELSTLHCSAAEGLRIGATARVAHVLEHPQVRSLYPAVAHAASQTATVPVRNRATVVGNACNASPCADNVPVLVARGARVEIVRAGGRRSVEIEAFFRGPGVTVLEPDELVQAIVLPPPPPRSGASYFNISARSKVDLSAVSAGVLVEKTGARCTGARIVMGAVGPVPLRAKKAESVLIDSDLRPEALAEAGAAAAEESRPIGDVRASAEWRRRMVGVLVRRAVAEAAARADARQEAGAP